MKSRSEQQLLSACKAALKAFRNMYDDYEAGKDFEDIYQDKKYWPLRKLREAIESTGVDPFTFLITSNSP